MTPPSPNSPQWHRQKLHYFHALKQLLIDEGKATEAEADTATAHLIRHHQRALDALTKKGSKR